MTIRLIHLGVGGRGKWPVRRVPERDDLSSVALVDFNEDNLTAAMEVSGLGESSCFCSLDVALNNVEAEAVVVVTPPQFHAGQCLQAIRAGKHVLVEKPFTKSLVEARSLVTEATKHGVKIAVCQNARYSAAHVTINRLVREGVYGKPMFGLITKFGWRPGVHHSGTDAHSYLWERGIHDLDTLRFLFDSQPARIWGHSFNPVWSPYAGGAGVHAWVEFENGATCGYLCTFAAHKGGSSLRIELEGGALELSGAGLSLRKPGTEVDEMIALDEVPHAEEILLDGFVNYVENGIEPEFSGANNLTTVALVEGLGIASDEGRVIDFGSIMDSGG
jgi:predicted dehydrogenase